MKHSLTIALILGAIISPAMITTGAAADQAYLGRAEPKAKQNFAQVDSTTQSKAHAATNDPATEHNRPRHRKAVAYLLDQYRDGWLWSLGRR